MGDKKQITFGIPRTKNDIIVRFDQRLQELENDCILENKIWSGREMLPTYKKLIEILSDYLDGSSLFKSGLFLQHDGRLSIVVQTVQRRINFIFPSYNAGAQIEVLKTDENFMVTNTSIEVKKDIVVHQLQWLTQ